MSLLEFINSHFNCYSLATLFNKIIFKTSRSIVTVQFHVYFLNVFTGLFVPKVSYSSYGNNVKRTHRRSYFVRQSFEHVVLCLAEGIKHECPKHGGSIQQQAHMACVRIIVTTKS